MKFKAVMFAAVFSSSLLYGQFGPGAPPPEGPGRMGRGGPHGMHAGKVVTGAPYSATVTDTSVRTLADGNTIQRTTTGTVARDSQGRTYSQETMSGMFGQSGSKTMTFISDPVAGYVYTLNADNKTAMRRALPTPSGNGSDKATTGHTSPDAVTTDLGTQMVNGVNAQGKTVTRTIPAGQIGNEKPIVSTTESWYSPDLQVTVSSKRTNPEQGTSTYALTNIQRTEPSSTLFVVPSDYTIKDAAAFGPHH